MSVFETIKRRRSIGKMTEQRPSREQIERLLEAATHAPNHHKVEPWEFIALAGKARAELGLIMRESLASSIGDTANEKVQALLNKEGHKPLRSPVLIVVVAKHSTQPKVLDIREHRGHGGGCPEYAFDSRRNGTGLYVAYRRCRLRSTSEEETGPCKGGSYCSFRVCWLCCHSPVGASPQSF